MTRRQFPCAILAAALGGIAVACALTDSTDPAPPPSVQGQWNYREAFTDLLNGLTCSDTGTYNLVESAGKFSGTYRQVGSCHTTDWQVIDISSHGDVTDGQVSGRHILFRAPGCSYDGLIRVNEENHVQGTVACSASTGGTTYNFTGNWSADR